VSKARWELVVAPSAERLLRRLPEKIAAAIVEFMLGPLLENPRRVGRELHADLKGLWSARRGAYRIVHEIDDRSKEIRVLRVEHRADVYRPR
jgi:mRNA interferase RelE/StbE